MGKDTLANQNGLDLSTPDSTPATNTQSPSPDPVSNLAEQLKMLQQRQAISEQSLQQILSEGPKLIQDKVDQAKKEALQLKEDYMQPTPNTPQQILGDLLKVAGIATFGAIPGLGASLAYLGGTIKEADPQYQAGKKRVEFNKNLLDAIASLNSQAISQIGQNQNTRAQAAIESAKSNRESSGRTFDTLQSIIAQTNEGAKSRDLQRELTGQEIKSRQDIAKMNIDAQMGKNDNSILAGKNFLDVAAQSVIDKITAGDINDRSEADQEIQKIYADFVKTADKNAAGQISFDDFKQMFLEKLQKQSIRFKDLPSIFEFFKRGSSDGAVKGSLLDDSTNYPIKHGPRNLKQEKD